MTIRLDRDEARRIAVRAQLLDADRPTGLVEVVRQLTFVQLEPTAAIAPTADLVLHSRLGSSYQPAHLTRALERDGSLFELNLLVRPMEDLALFRAAMALPSPYETTQRWLADNVEFRDDILVLLEEGGPTAAKDIPDTSVVSWRSSGWNAGRNVTMMLDELAARGAIAVAGRRGRDRLWDLAERVYHSDIPAIPLEEATRRRDDRRLRSLGIVSDTTPNLHTEPTKVGEAGEPATVDGTRGTWRVDPQQVGRPFHGRTALLSPFDGLIRDRRRMKDLFEFDYVLEMYKPAAKRRFGYYALPILHGDLLVGKVDAAADRDHGILVVNAIHEDDGFTADAADGVHAELEALAGWLGLALHYR